MIMIAILIPGGSILLLYLAYSYMLVSQTYRNMHADIRTEQNRNHIFTAQTMAQYSHLTQRDSLTNHFDIVEITCIVSLFVV